MILNNFLLFILALAGAGNALAQSYPDKPLRLLVGFPAGSALDSAARPIATKLSDLLGQNVIVDNRAGAAGNIATEIAARARPDGYTLLFGANGALAINPALYEKLPFDSGRDFAPIAKVVDAVNVLAVHPSAPAATVEQLVVSAKSTAKPLLGGSGGVGSPGHLALELFNMMAAVKITHVPYKGSAPALVDVIAGNIQVLFSTLTPALPHIKSSRIKVLAVTSLKRSELVPELPTVSESGLKGFEVTGWYGVLAPAQTPRALINRLHAETVKALQSAEVRQNLLAQGFEISPSGPDAFAAFIRTEREKWAKVVKFSGARAN
jgi:tripartite-type tricarboxylate transporter receptor subunit TctC